MNRMEDLEALLSDLQRTTEVLRRGASRDRDSADLDPIYQEQQQKSRSAHGLDHLEQMLDNYSHKRRSITDGGGTPQRPTVHSLFTQLDQDSSTNRRSPAYANGYGSAHDLRGKSPQSRERDPCQMDSMIGTLGSDINKHGINTIPKGDCAGCGKAIVGQVVIALGKMWHPEHYVCCQCGEELGHRNFFERSGKAYCENDYHDLFSPRCAYCNGAIKDRCVTAMGSTFHTEHFICAECGRPFGEEGFHEREGRAFCREDFFRLFAPKCRGCKKPIKQNFITALGTQWHADCFVCQECHRRFDAGNFFELSGVPLCETHYHEKRGSLCAQCRKPISGRCVSAMGNKFHPEHFCCSYCSRQLNKGTFKESDGKPFCHKCYEKTHPALTPLN